MKYICSICLILLLVAKAGAANADCYADYKAKQDDPLRLHYGVAQVQGDCSVQNAEDQLRRRLAAQGWQLLNVLDLFDEIGRDDRKDSAGDFFLRY